MISPGLTVVATLGILVTIPALSILYREFLDRTGLRSSVLLTLVISAGSLVIWVVVSWFVPDVATSPLEFPTAALAAVSGFLAGLTVRDTTSHWIAPILYSFGWTLLVFSPVALAVLFPSTVGIGVLGGPLDLGGALPVHAAVGTGALVVLSLARRWTVSDRSHVRPRSWLLLASGLVIWAGSVVGFVGLESQLDDVVTPRIVTNTLVAPLFGALGWLIVQRIMTRRNTPFGAVAGLLAGLVAISAGCAFFTPLWAGVTGLIAGLACAAFATGRVRKTGRHAWLLVGIHLVAAVIGLGMVGIFGSDVGLVYDGQITLLQSQVLGIGAVILWSGFVSLALWLVVRGAARRRAHG